MTLASLINKELDDTLKTKSPWSRMKQFGDSAIALIFCVVLLLFYTF